MDTGPDATDVSRWYREFAPRVRGYFRRHGARDDQAEDLVQETFHKVFLKAAQLRTRDCPAAWLWTIARNTLIDSTRAAHRNEQVWSEDGEREAVVADSAPEPDESLTGHDLRDCVRRGFKRLEREHPQRAACLRWAITDGLSMDQLAQVLGRTAGATREYLSQCRRKLREYLSHCREYMTA